MIIARAPFRVSFFGGGTDYPGWYREHGGAVLGTTIDKFCWITLRHLPPFFEYRGRLVYSKTELFRDLDEIQHPVIREGLRAHGSSHAIEMHHDGDLPARTGLGTSSTFTVCFLHAVHALQGRMLTRMELARKAIHLEQEVLRENVGSQDQVAAAFGGFNRVDFARDGSIWVNPVVVPKGRFEELEAHLMLWFTGFARTASEIAAAQVRRLGELEQELRSIRELVDRGQDALCSSRDISEFGELLHESWMLKRSLTSQISTPAIDGVYERAREAGAIGGKLLGAGGGGFILLFARPDRHAAIEEALRPLLRVPFRFERHGSQLVHYEPEDLGARL